MQQAVISIALVVLASGVVCSQARSLGSDDASVSGVIPSPNQEFSDGLDLQRTSSASATRPTKAARAPVRAAEHSAQASDEAAIPVYASPFARAEQRAAAASHYASQESSHAPPNYAPRPTASDLKMSASYGHGHHHQHGYQGGHHGYDHSGWLDMGAWTGGKGSFGWYADYPVGGKHHGYYGRR